MISGRCDWITASSSGTIGCSDDSFFSCSRMQRVFQIGNHLVGVGDEVGRQVATVELHAFDDFGFGLQALVLFDGDDTLVADLLHRVSDLTADFRFAVGRDGADLRDFGAVLDRTGRRP